MSSGIWPVVHRRSFEAVTGPKTDYWLVQTVGLTVVAIGAGLARAATRRTPISPDIRTTAILGASALTTIDLIFVWRRRISPVYLLDAVTEATLVAAWATARRRPDSTRALLPAMPPMPDRLLEIYLSDHLAAATAGVALARRTARSNAETEFADTLGRLADEIELDRQTLERIVGELGFRTSKTKEAVAWVGEKIGRLKLNGQIRGYSPLSRVLELEMLSVGVAGKRALWESLRATPRIRERLAGFDLDALIERARRQRVEIEEYRVRAAREAFAPPAPARGS